MFSERKRRRAAAAFAALLLVLAAGLQASAEEVNNGSLGRYIVQKGDSLWSLARQNNTSVDLLAEINDLDPQGILPELQTLTVPVNGEFVYEVIEGDTLWDIARRFDTSVDALAEKNGQEILGVLMAGRTLTVPVMVAEAGAEEETEAEETDAELTELPHGLDWPVSGRVSSVFGFRKGRMHEGLDIAAEHGEPVRAIRGGFVVFAGPRGDYGNTVIIDHGRGFRSLYAHNSGVLVEVGQRVLPGQRIALVGSTGRSTGPHLHLELLYKGRPVNPGKYLNEKSSI